MKDDVMSVFLHIEKVDEKMESPHISNSEKLIALENLLQHLEHMESDLANKYREVAEVYRTSILDDYIQEIVDSPEMSEAVKLAELKDLLDPKGIDDCVGSGEVTINRIITSSCFFILSGCSQAFLKYLFNEIHI